MFFFFSSRRRHTRCSRDWSSDVCSSDLAGAPASKSTRRCGRGKVSLRPADETKRGPPYPMKVIEISCLEVWREISNFLDGEADPEMRARMEEIGRASCRERV